MFVNNDLIKKAGAKTPAELIAAGQWTWDTAIATAPAVGARPARRGLVVRDFDYKAWQYLASVWSGWGAGALERRRQDLRLRRPAQMVDAMTLPAQGDLHRQGDARPGRSTSTSSPATRP